MSGLKAENLHRSPRARWIRIGFVCVSLLALALGALNKYYYYYRPSDDCTWIDSENGVVIRSVVPDGATDKAGLQSGDILLRIAGENATTAERAQAILDNQRVGHTIPYLVLRDGTLLSLDVEIVEGGLPPIVLIMLIVGLVYWIIGFWIGWMRPLDAKAQVLFWLFLSFMIFWTLNNVPPLSRALRLTILILNTIAFTTIPGFFLYFFLLYPKRHPFIAGACWKRFILFSPTFLLLVWLIIASFLEQPSPINFVMGIGLWGVYFIIALTRLGQAYRRTDQLFLRQQMRILFWGLLIGLLPAFALIINSGFRLNHPMVIYSVPLMGLIPLVFAYTVIRHRLMDIEFIVKKSFAYSVLTGLILVFYILIVQILGHLLQDITGLASTGILVICTLLVAIVFTPLRERILKTVDKAFYREAYNYRATLRQFARTINTLIDPDILIKMVLKNLVDTMHINEAVFFIHTDGDCCCCASYPQDLSNKTVHIPADSFFYADIRDASSPIRVTDIPESHRVHMSIIERPALIVPLVQQDHFLGFIVLGEKQSGSPYSSEDIELLATLADQVAVSYENGRLHLALTDQERMKRELEIAHHIQMQSLPQDNPHILGYDIYGTSIPATEVGGDYYDYFSLPDGKLGLVVGDVSGKGTSAALYMSKIQGFFRALSSFYTSPKALLSRINTLAFENVEGKSFITLIAAFLDPDDAKLTIARAGHTSVVLFEANKETCQEWAPTGIGMALDKGKMFDETLKEESKTLNSGDVFLLYTDGITEAENADAEEFGEQHLIEDFLKISLKSATSEEIGNHIIASIKAFASDHPQKDDITLIVVKKL